MKKVNKIVKGKKGEPLVQISGEIPKQYRSLAEILGEEDPRVGNVEKLDQYRAKLKEMNNADLQEHCVEVGLLPDDNRHKMIERLEREWKKSFSKYRYVYQSDDLKLDEKSKETVLSIMRGAK